MKNSENKKTFALPRSRILRGKRNFERIFQQGKYFAGATVDLRYVIIDHTEPNCLVGFVTGRRLGKAVHRNKIRRRMREAFRLHAHILNEIELPENKQVHFVLIAKNIHASYSEITNDIVSLLEKLSVQLQS